MINLIPNQEKKKKVKDFYFRLGVVFLSMLGMSVFVALLAALPSYFLSYVEKNIAEEKLTSLLAESVPLVDQNSIMVMEELDRKLVLLEGSEKERYVVSANIIDEILEEKMPDIKIRRISYEEGPEGRRADIYGLAPSRERLLLFRTSLEENVAFKKVDLPISNFVKGSDIEFFLSVTPS